MKRTFGILVVTMIAALVAAAQVGKETRTDEAAILEADDKLNRSVLDKDGRTIGSLLTDSFITVSSGIVLDKPWFVMAMTGIPCEGKPSPPADRKLMKISDGTALMTGIGSAEMVCYGETSKSEVRFATLWERDGGNWKAAYFQGLITKEEKSGQSKDSGNEVPASDHSEMGQQEIELPRIPNDEAMAKALLKTVNELFDARAKKNTKPFERLLAANFISLSAEGLNDRAAEIRSVKENPCKVDEYSIGDAKATKVNDGLYIFTNSVSQYATCGGDPVTLGGTSTTIFTKDGNTWKPLFHMITPAW